jgi:hypothetical protein
MLCVGTQEKLQRRALQQGELVFYVSSEYDNSREWNLPEK